MITVTRKRHDDDDQDNDDDDKDDVDVDDNDNDEDEDDDDMPLIWGSKPALFHGRAFLFTSTSYSSWDQNHLYFFAFLHGKPPPSPFHPSPLPIFYGLKCEISLSFQVCPILIT